MVNKARRFSSPLFRRPASPALGDYPAKSGPITSLSPLISRSVSSWRTMLSHSIRSFHHLLCSLHSSLTQSIRPRVRALSIELLAPLLRGSFRSTFSYFCHFASITSINHHTFVQPPPAPPAPRILTSDCNFGSFVWSLLGSLLFLPVLHLIFSFNHELFIDPPTIVLPLASVLHPQFSSSSFSRRVLNLDLTPFFISHFDLDLRELKTPHDSSG